MNENLPTTTLQFWLNGQLQSIEQPNTNSTLLQFLRNDLGLCGTKEGCAEGDCGACTVLLIESEDQAALSVRPINSCIRLLPTLHGKAVISVEGLSSPNKALHPAAQAMIDCHGSQCGFCTPGFVMSLVALYKNQPQANQQQICDALAGNLCRCTGYRPIIDAALKMKSIIAVESEQTNHWESWLGQPGLSDCAAIAQDLNQLRKPVPITPPMRVHGDDISRFFVPTSAQEVSQLIKAHPNAWLLSGGTDIGLWVTKQLQRQSTLIYLGDVPSLKTMSVNGQFLDVGAAVTLDKAFARLDQFYPALSHVWQRFASVPVRSSATLGGNIANGSPIGDSMPILIALGTQIVLSDTQGDHTIALEDLYLDYKKQARRIDQWVSRIRIPLPTNNQHYAAYKFSKRPDQDISAVLAAMCIVQVDNTITHARLAFGGMAATPKRALLTEAALLNQPFELASFVKASEQLTVEFAPLSDMRASAQYRMQVAQNSLVRFAAENGLLTGHSPNTLARVI
jgi:xanthine dehydrogenase small subunit